MPDDRAATFVTSCTLTRRLPKSPPSSCPPHVWGLPALYCSHDKVQTCRGDSIRASAPFMRTHLPLHHVNSNSNPDGLLTHSESRPETRCHRLAVLVHKARLGFSQLFAFHLSLMTQLRWNLLHTLLHWTVHNASSFSRPNAQAVVRSPWHLLSIPFT